MRASDIQSLATQRRRIEQHVLSTLDAQLLNYRGHKVALAVSGGLDSRALLEAVARWPFRHECTFVVMTLNHHTRPECEVESQAVLARAKCLGFESHIINLYPLGRDEATLRQARYDLISELMHRAGIKVLCTAHQRDDDAEGVIMDLFGFGGGAHGAGLSRARVADFGTLLRPFLGLQRKELLLFLTAVGATDYFSDPSNENGSCARQKARDFLKSDALKLHRSPTERLATIAQRRSEHSKSEVGLPCDERHISLNSDLGPAELRAKLQSAYMELCAEKDPRNAAPIIEMMVKKAISCDFIREVGVDRGGNSITLGRPARLNFDLPGAKASMAPGILSLYRNHSNLLLQ